MTAKIKKLTPKSMANAAKLIEKLDDNKKLIAQCQDCVDHRTDIGLNLGSGKHRAWTFSLEVRDRLAQFLIDEARVENDELIMALSPYVDFGDASAAATEPQTLTLPHEQVCIAMTAAGPRCSRRPLPDTPFCVVHRINRPHGVAGNGSAVAATS